MTDILLELPQLQFVQFALDFLLIHIGIVPKEHP
jgi:hypothetical protein